MTAHLLSLWQSLVYGRADATVVPVDDLVEVVWAIASDPESTLACSVLRVMARGGIGEAVVMDGSVGEPAWHASRWSGSPHVDDEPAGVTCARGVLRSFVATAMRRSVRSVVLAGHAFCVPPGRERLAGLLEGAGPEMEAAVSAWEAAWSEVPEAVRAGALALDVAGTVWRAGLAHGAWSDQPGQFATSSVGGQLGTMDPQGGYWTHAAGFCPLESVLTLRESLQQLTSGGDLPEPEVLAEEARRFLQAEVPFVLLRRDQGATSKLGTGSPRDGRLLSHLMTSESLTGQSHRAAGLWYASELGRVVGGRVAPRVTLVPFGSEAAVFASSSLQTFVALNASLWTGGEDGGDGLVQGMPGDWSATPSATLARPLSGYLAEPVASLADSLASGSPEERAVASLVGLQQQLQPGDSGESATVLARTALRLAAVSSALQQLRTHGLLMGSQRLKTLRGSDGCLRGVLRFNDEGNRATAERSGDPWVPLRGRDAEAAAAWSVAKPEASETKHAAGRPALNSFSTFPLISAGPRDLLPDALLPAELSSGDKPGPQWQAGLVEHAAAALQEVWIPDALASDAAPTELQRAGLGMLAFFASAAEALAWSGGREPKASELQPMVPAADFGQRLKAGPIPAPIEFAAFPGSPVPARAMCDGDCAGTFEDLQSQLRMGVSAGWGQMAFDTPRQAAPLAFDVEMGGGGTLRVGAELPAGLDKPQHVADQAGWLNSAASMLFGVSPGQRLSGHGVDVLFGTEQASVSRVVRIPDSGAGAGLSLAGVLPPVVRTALIPAGHTPAVHGRNTGLGTDVTDMPVGYPQFLFMVAWTRHLAEMAGFRTAGENSLDYPAALPLASRVTMYPSLHTQATGMREIRRAWTNMWSAEFAEKRATGAQLLWDGGGAVSSDRSIAAGGLTPTIVFNMEYSERQMLDPAAKAGFYDNGAAFVLDYSTMPGEFFAKAAASRYCDASGERIPDTWLVHSAAVAGARKQLGGAAGDHPSVAALAILLRRPKAQPSHLDYLPKPILPPWAEAEAVRVPRGFEAAETSQLGELGAATIVAGPVWRRDMRLPLLTTQPFPFVYGPTHEFRLPPRTIESMMGPTVEHAGLVPGMIASGKKQRQQLREETGKPARIMVTHFGSDVPERRDAVQAFGDFFNFGKVQPPEGELVRLRPATHRAAREVAASRDQMPFALISPMLATAMSFGPPWIKVVRQRPAVVNVHLFGKPGDAVLEQSRLMPIIGSGSALILTELGSAYDEWMHDVMVHEVGAVIAPILSVEGNRRSGVAGLFGGRGRLRFRRGPMPAGAAHIPVAGELPSDEAEALALMAKSGSMARKSARVVGLPIELQHTAPLPKAKTDNYGQAWRGSWTRAEAAAAQALVPRDAVDKSRSLRGATMRHLETSGGAVRFSPLTVEAGTRRLGVPVQATGGSLDTWSIPACTDPDHGFDAPQWAIEEETAPGAAIAQLTKKEVAWERGVMLATGFTDLLLQGLGEGAPAIKPEAQVLAVPERPTKGDGEKADAGSEKAGAGGEKAGAGGEKAGAGAAPSRALAEEEEEEEEEELSEAELRLAKALHQRLNRGQAAARLVLRGELMPPVRLGMEMMRTMMPPWRLLAEEALAGVAEEEAHGESLA